MTRRTSARIAAAATAAALLFGAQVHGSSPALGSGDDGREHAPPPPIRDNVPSAAPEVAEGGLRAATTQYSHGDPTDD